MSDDAAHSRPPAAPATQGSRRPDAHSANRGFARRGNGKRAYGCPERAGRWAGSRQSSAAAGGDNTEGHRRRRCAAAGHGAGNSRRDRPSTPGVVVRGLFESKTICERQYDRIADMLERTGCLSAAPGRCVTSHSRHACSTPTTHVRWRRWFVPHGGAAEPTSR